MSEPIAAVLMYHRISKTGADRELLCVPPAEFTLQMRQLRRDGYEVLPLDDLADGLMRGKLPARAVAITFDDGYLDSVTVAAPVLAEFGLPASFFVVTATQERPGEFWWDTVERVLGDESPTPDRLELEVSGAPMPLSTAGVAARREARQQIKRVLIGLARDGRDELIADLLDWNSNGLPMIDDARAMTGDEVRELAAIPGMAVGSHTVNHLLLPAQSPEVKQAELTGSRRSLEQLLGREVAALCYPYGGFDVATIAAAQAAGYRYALSTGNLPVTRDSHPFAIPRLAVRTGEDFAGKLHGVFG